MKTICSEALYCLFLTKSFPQDFEYYLDCVKTKGIAEELPRKMCERITQSMTICVETVASLEMLQIEGWEGVFKDAFGPADEHRKAVMIDSDRYWSMIEAASTAIGVDLPEQPVDETATLPDDKETVA